MIFPGGLESKESAWNVGDLGLIPELGRSPGEGNGNPLQYTCLNNPWTKEPHGLQSKGSQRVRYHWATEQHSTHGALNNEHLLLPRVCGQESRCSLLDTTAQDFSKDCNQGVSPEALTSLYPRRQLGADLLPSSPMRLLAASAPSWLLLETLAPHCMGLSTGQLTPWQLVSFRTVS